MSPALDPGSLAFMKSFRFALISLDSDFAEMAALLGSPPKVIWLRCGNQPTALVESLLRNNVDAITAFELDKDAACLEIY